MTMGTAPTGFGTGDPAPLPPTGAWGSRYVNPATGDYEYDTETRQLKQMPAVRQRFLLKLTTLLSSSSVRPNDGVKLPRKLDASVQSEVDDTVRQAMRQETEVEKVARIDSVSVERDPNNSGRAAIVVEFTDLTTGAADQLRF